MSLNYYYITTTLPYINAEPHLGFALEIIRADVLARWRRLQGDQVFFNTGTDEHGLKIFRKAEELKMPPLTYCDQMAVKWQALKSTLDLSYDNFIRTTDEDHQQAAQEFWRRCQRSGDIYKKNYQIKYCVGCELEKTDSELIDDRCPLHPNQSLELINEENYFFRFSAYQKKLLSFYESQSDFVWPQTKFNEIKKFVAQGLNDFSISRLKSKMPWGVPVPNDDSQVMYVWFDALVNYISALGWPKDQQRFSLFWPGIQVCGKDNLRQQTAMWQAMLMSAGLPNSRQVFVNGFITVGGKKMSKSLNNVIDPVVLAADYGSDAVRYYLLAEIISQADGDFTLDKFIKKYNADLANGLGNLIARVSNLCDKNQLVLDLKNQVDQDWQTEIDQALKLYDFSLALNLIWQRLRQADEYISLTKPWQIVDQNELTKVLSQPAQIILSAGLLLRPFLPQTADKIIAQFSGPRIIKMPILFPRLS